MLYYAGGTYVDSSTTNYQFWYNFFSDLGRTIAHSGISNITAFILFIIAFSVWGIFQIPFFIAFTFLFTHIKNLRVISPTASILGILSGICYIGIAFTPSNLLNPIHELFVGIGFSSIFASIILYAIAIFQNKEFSNFYAITLTISAAILTIYFILLYLHPSIRTPRELLIQATGQKIMMYTLLLCGILLGYGTLQHELHDLVPK